MKAPPIFKKSLFSPKKVGGILFLLLYFLLTVSFLHAREAPQGPERAKEAPRFELGEIVVSATRMEEPLRNVPRNVSVITGEDIQQATSNNVVDLLANEIGSYSGSKGIKISEPGKYLLNIQSDENWSISIETPQKKKTPRIEKTFYPQNSISTENIKIRLKSGRIIKTTRCWEDGNMLMYEKYGGVIGVPKNKVMDIK